MLGRGAESEGQVVFVRQGEKKRREGKGKGKGFSMANEFPLLPAGSLLVCVLARSRAQQGSELKSKEGI